MTGNSRLTGAAATFAASLLYFLLLRIHGFQVEDEGTLLFQIDRVVGGQRPYVDFHTGYTPGFFAMAAAAMRALDHSLVGMRVALAVINAASAATLYLIARRFVGAWMAAIAPALWVSFIPVYVGGFAAFNVPYPAWPATTAWMLVAASMLEWSKRGGIGWLVAAGLASALAFSIKLNAGAFSLAACTWIVATTARGDRMPDRAAAALAAAAMALGVWFAFGFALASTDALVHLIPTLIIVVLALGPHAHRLSSPAHPRALPALAALALGFVAPTAAWILPLLSELGAADFASEVLLIGSDAAALYHIAYPLPNSYALAVTSALAAVVAGGLAVSATRVSPLLLAGAAVAGASVPASRIASRMLMPEGVLVSIEQQLEFATFTLAPLVNLGAIAYMVALVYRPKIDARARRMAALVPLAVAMYLQLFPRADFMHLVMAVPLTAVAGAVLLDWVVGCWSAGRWPRGMSGPRVVNTLVAGAVVGAVALEVLLAAPAWTGGRERSPTGLIPRLEGASLGNKTADDLAALRMTAELIARQTDDDEPLLAFPALTAVLYGAARPSAVPHDYWYAGRPDHDEEAAMLATLAADPPRYIVSLNDGWTFFKSAPAYFARTRAFVVDNYRIAARLGRFDVLARSDVAIEKPIARLAPAGPLEAAIEPRLDARRQAARRWMAGLTVEQASSAVLPQDTADAVLLLRAIRDGGDFRAAGWVVAGLRSEDHQIRREALDVSNALVEAIGIARLRWADDFDPAAYAPFLTAHADRARTLLADEAARPLAAALLELVDRGAEDREDRSRPRRVEPVGSRPPHAVPAPSAHTH